MNYAKIETYRQGELVREYFEPLTIESITVALETEFLEDAEEGDRIRITVVEMSEEEYQAIAETQGY